MTLVFGSIWHFGREHYFMIDAVQPAELERASIMSIVDFTTELMVLLLFDILVYHVWRVHLYNLAQDFARAVRWMEVFSTVADCIFILTFLMHHFGGKCQRTKRWFLLLPSNLRY